MGCAEGLRVSHALAELHDATTDGLRSACHLRLLGQAEQSGLHARHRRGYDRPAIRRRARPSFWAGASRPRRITSSDGSNYSDGHTTARRARCWSLPATACNSLSPTDPAKGPVSPIGTLNDIGTLQVGILKNADVTEFTPATEDNFLPIAEIDYQADGWLLNTSGIAAFTLTMRSLRSSPTFRWRSPRPPR